MPVDELRRRTAKLQRQVSLRNLVEFVAGAIVCVAFVAYIVHFQSAWLKIGSALALAATVFVLTNLHFRAGARKIDLSSDCQSFYVGELNRQRDAFRSVWRWYLLPFLPGFVVFRIGVHLELPQGKQLVHYLYDAGAFLIAAGIVWINRRAARRLDAQIEEVKAPSEE